MPLSDIVNVVITKDVKPVSQAGFGTMLILGTNFNTDSRVEYFSDPVLAAAKVVGSTTLEASLVSLALGQNPAPTRIALGSLSASKTLVFTGTYTAGSITALINGREHTAAYNSTMDGTLTDLATAIATDADVLSAVYTTGTDTLVVTPKASKTVGVVVGLTTVTGTLAYTLTATALSETYAEALAIIKADFPDWYGLCLADRTIATQQAVAAWAEANERIFIAGTADLGTVDETLAADTDSLAKLVKNLSYERTAVIFSKTAATEGIEAGWFGKFLPLNPGTYTCMFRTISGATVDALTDTQSYNALSKYANTYESLGGVSITRNGTVAAGEYLDIVIFVDWLKANISSAVFRALSSQPKVPYTAAGILIVKNAMQSPLKVGQDRGAISPDAFDPTDGRQIGGFYIETPAFASIPVNDKASRLLQDMKFTAFLSGAIHKTVINGVVTV